MFDIIISMKHGGGEKMKRKKKTAEILSEIDSNLDKVLSIITKLALAAMGIKTIAEIVISML